MLRVVAENLITNAIRYSGPGTMCRITLDRDRDEPVLVVADDGKGVSEADLPRLFERFYRADQARSSRGTGLGLAIVKHIVTSAGGTVEARGGPTRGVEIVCRFPAE
jgi:signal transduction histidine kinase